MEFYNFRDNHLYANHIEWEGGREDQVWVNVM